MARDQRRPLAGQAIAAEERRAADHDLPGPAPARRLPAARRVPGGRRDRPPASGLRPRPARVPGRPREVVPALVPVQEEELAFGGVEETKINEEGEEIVDGTDGVITPTPPSPIEDTGVPTVDAMGKQLDADFEAPLADDESSSTSF